jgi:hypothetical protein
VERKESNAMIVSLEGGCGNQLFQAAFGLSVAKARGEECFFTRHKLEHDPNGRVYELGHFAADIKFVEREEEPICWDSWYHNPGVYDKKWQSFAGHWQTEKYFDAPLVRQATKLRHPVSIVSSLTAIDIFLQPSAFIHVRRTDTLKPEEIEYHGRCSDGYYARAIDHIREKVPGVRFFVFSDDPWWCREHFSKDFTFVDYNLASAHEDLWLMSLCNHAIIANSTFSWMGAWLGDQQKDRIVIAPSKWFRIGLNYSDVVPDRWLKFDN